MLCTPRSVIRNSILQVVALSLACATIVFTGAAAQAEPNALKVDAKVTLHSESGEESVLVEQRNWTVPLNRRFSSYLGSFSVELQTRLVDSLRSEISVFLATSGPRPDSRTKQFLIEHTLPARVENIRGKAGATYTLTLTPQGYSELDLSVCEYDHRDSGSFKFDPTAHFDLYYVQHSLGDYHWNKVKGLLEEDYRSFRDAFDITISGKLNFFLYPCAAPTVDWDSRFGYAIDPPRAQALAIYNHEYMAASPMVATLMQTLRVFGYAPPFLAEGISSYHFFNNYETLRALADSALLPIRPLLTTQGYYRAEPRLAAAVAGSFCRFLADEHGIGKFMRWYKVSDDLNVAARFQEIFGSPIEEFEKLWVTYLQGLHPPQRAFHKRAGLEGAFSNPEGAIAVLQEGLRWDTSIIDTLKSLEALAPLYAEIGRNDLALRTYDALYRSVSEEVQGKPYYLFRKGYFEMLTGDFSAAQERFTELRDADTLYRDVAVYNIGRTYLVAGDTVSAIQSFTELIEHSSEEVVLIESALHLAHIYGEPGRFADPLKSGQMFIQAFNRSSQLVNAAPQEPLHRMRQGMAAIGLEKYSLARQNLEAALFLEFRPRYLGRELVALGNLADLQGDRAQALEYYNRADSLDQSAPGQQATDRYLQKPLQLKITLPDNAGE